MTKIADTYIPMERKIFNLRPALCAISRLYVYPDSQARLDGYRIVIARRHVLGDVTYMTKAQLFEFIAKHELVEE